MARPTRARTTVRAEFRNPGKPMSRLPPKPKPVAGGDGVKVPEKRRLIIDLGAAWGRGPI